MVSRGETIIFSFFKLLQYRVMGSGDGRVGTCFLMDQCNLKNVPSILTEESYIKHLKKISQINHNTMYLVPTMWEEKENRRNRLSLV